MKSIKKYLLESKYMFDKINDLGIIRFGNDILNILADINTKKSNYWKFDEVACVDVFKINGEKTYRDGALKDPHYVDMMGIYEPFGGINNKLTGLKIIHNELYLEFYFKWNDNVEYLKIPYKEFVKNRYYKKGHFIYDERQMLNLINHLYMLMQAAADGQEIFI